MDNQLVTGAMGYLKSYMDAAHQGMMDQQSTKPGTVARSKREMSDIYKRLQQMEPAEREEKLKNLAGTVGTEHLISFLQRHSREK